MLFQLLLSWKTLSGIPERSKGEREGEERHASVGSGRHDNGEGIKDRSDGEAPEHGTKTLDVSTDRGGNARN